MSPFIDDEQRERDLGPVPKVKPNSGAPAAVAFILFLLSLLACVIVELVKVMK